MLYVVYTLHKYSSWNHSLVFEDFLIHYFIPDISDNKQHARNRYAYELPTNTPWILIVFCENLGMGYF